MLSCARIHVKPVEPVGDLNIFHQYHVQKASWIGHPDSSMDQDLFLSFVLDFSLPEAEKFILHLSADQRFELSCDGMYVGMGPDRSDIHHWSFHSYEISCEKGKHALEAHVHYLTNAFVPQAQNSCRPGFILASERCSAPLDTGSAPWKVKRKKGFSFRKIRQSFLS